MTSCLFAPTLGGICHWAEAVTGPLRTALGIHHRSHPDKGLVIPVWLHFSAVRHPSLRTTHPGVSNHTLHCKPTLPLDGVLLPLGGSVTGEMSKQLELRPLITWQPTRRTSLPLKGFEFTPKLNL